MGVEPMLVSPMRAELMLPSSFSTTAATPTIAQSCDLRANFLYDQPVFGPSLGTLTSVTTSCSPRSGIRKSTKKSAG